MTKTVLVPSNEVFTIANILSPAECSEYIALSENIGYTGAPITTLRGFEMRPDIRNNERVILDDPERALDLWQRVSAYIPTTIGKWRAIGLNERFRFYRYDPAQRFAPHHDGCYRRPNGEESILTHILHLAVETAQRQRAHKRNLPIALALRVAHHAGYETLNFPLVRAGGLGMQ